MTYYEMRTRTGGIVTAQEDAVWFPSGNRATGKPGVILLHGATAPSQFNSHNARWESVALGAALARAGFGVIAGAMGGDTFANDAVMGYVTNAHAYLAAQTGASSTRVHLVGVSMGGAVGLRWAIQNPTKVASYTGIIPLVDIDNLYQSNAGGLRASIGTAWGVTHPTALPAGANLPAQAGALSGVVPTQLFYAADDTQIPASTVIAMGTTLGAEAINVGNLGHTEAAIGAVGDLSTPKWQGLIDFLEENGS